MIGRVFNEEFSMVNRSSSSAVQRNTRDGRLSVAVTRYRELLINSKIRARQDVGPIFENGSLKRSTLTNGRFRNYSDRVSVSFYLILMTRSFARRKEKKRKKKKKKKEKVNIGKEIRVNLFISFVIHFALSLI